MQRFPLLIPIFSFVLFSGCNTNKIITPLEESYYTKLTKNNELINFIKKCSQKSNCIGYEIIGNSEAGKPIPLICIKSENNSKNKVTTLLIGQQHGNEPSGKEGLLLLIKEFANGNHTALLDSVNLLIIPQCNPDGGDLNKRRTLNGIDLNRDHLLLKAKETQLIQKIFLNHKPEFTVDFHEYYPYGKGWEDFGYRRDFDIQPGGLTNINIDRSIRNWFYKKTLPKVCEKLMTHKYSFGEYTLGYFPENERLRHSTVDINDGRQSMGIAQTMSFIVEGKRGRDSIDLIEQRSKSQYLTALALIEAAYENCSEILDIVQTARNHSLKKEEKIAIRLEHVKGNEPLHYKLLSLKTHKDTVFIVDNFHSNVISTLDVDVPKGYLIPKYDSMLCEWLHRSNFEYKECTVLKETIIGYEITQIDKSIDEEWKNIYAKVLRKKLTQNIELKDYYYIPTNQFFKYKIVTALEPQAMYGLANYSEFNYLLNQKIFPILRIE